MFPPQIRVPRGPRGRLPASVPQRAGIQRGGLSDPHRQCGADGCVAGGQGKGIAFRDAYIIGHVLYVKPYRFIRLRHKIVT